MAFSAPVGQTGSPRGVPRGVLRGVLSVLLLLLELRDGVHLRPGLHLAHLGRVVALHHQHVGHLAVFLLGKRRFCRLCPSAAAGALPPSKPTHTHPPPGGERGSTELLRQRRRAHLLSINVARRYGDHCGLAYEPGQEGADPERGPVDPGTSRGIILRAA